MYSRKLALSLAKQYRTCPPKEIREKSSNLGNLDQHLAICPYCSTQGPKGPDPWENLYAKLHEVYSAYSSSRKEGPVLAGQLRPVRPDRGRWRDGYFYNPPFVLVLTDAGSVSDYILVAQTYHDIHLAGPGDLILTEEQISIGPLFVEPWNTYTLKAASLGPPLCQVSHEITGAVKALENDPEAYPAWAMTLKPLTEHDARIYFRELEVEVGYTFSIEAVEELVSMLESPGLELVYSSEGELRHSMREIVPGIRWPKQVDTTEMILATARFPTAQLRLAANDTDQAKSTTNLVGVEQGKIKRLEPVPMVIYGSGLDRSDHFTIDGRVLEIPAGLSGSRFVCFLLPEHVAPIAPEDCQWDENTGSFLACFEGVRELEGKLAAAVVFSLSEE